MIVNVSKRSLQQDGDSDLKFCFSHYFQHETYHSQAHLKMIAFPELRKCLWWRTVSPQTRDRFQAPAVGQRPASDAPVWRDVFRVPDAVMCRHSAALPRLAPRRFVTVSALATVAFRLPACLCMMATETAGTSPPNTVDMRQRVNTPSFRHRSGSGSQKAWQISASTGRLPPSPEARATPFPQENQGHAIRRSTTTWNAGLHDK